MNSHTVILYALLLLAIIGYQKVSWGLYFMIGHTKGKRTADFFDFLFSSAFLVWLLSNGFYFIAGIGTALWLKTNMDKGYQAHLARHFAEYAARKNKIKSVK